MSQEMETIIGLLVALAIGLLIGIERGWSSGKKEEGERVAGIRTFSLVGLLGGACAGLSRVTGEWIIAIVFAAVAALIIVSYLAESRKSGDIGTTTAFAVMITFILAAWAGFGGMIYALGVTALVVALLGLKPVLHKWVRNIETKEIYAGMKLLIISVVLLPLLPNQGYGPWNALNPYWIWWMVVLICGISFVGYFAIKYIGNQMGTLITSITGGLASSTAVTFSMAQFARQYTRKTLFMAGVMFASSIMFIRIVVEVSIVNPELLHPLWIPLFVMFVSVVCGAIWLWKQRGSPDTDPSVEIKNPFRLTMALKFGALLAVILILSAAMKEWFGEQGIYVLAVISGLADVDAITLSLSRMSTGAEGDLREEVAILGIILAAATNTLIKGFIFSFFVGIKESLKLIGLLGFSVILGILTTGLIVF